MDEVIHTICSVGIMLVSLTLFVLSVSLFWKRWPEQNRVERLIVCACLSPVVYLLGCRVPDYAVMCLLEPLQVLGETTLYAVLRVSIATILHAALLFQAVRLWQWAVPVSRELGAWLYLSFTLIAAAAVMMPAGFLRSATALVLLLLLMLLMRREFSFLAQQDETLHYRHVLLPVALSALVTVGCVGTELILSLDQSRTAAQREDTAGWICVVAFILVLMILLLEKSMAQTIREAWEAYEEIVRNKGTQFSPPAVKAFEASFEDCLRVMEEFQAL